ncbi:MAG: hypothetical protein ACREMD_13815 [Gemmatimonadota bacterium]
MSPARETEAPGKPSVVAAAISGALVVALIGYLVIHAIGSNDPPAIVAGNVPGENWSRDGMTYLAIDVKNEGELAASDVQVQVQPDGNGAEVRRTTIDYLAGGETARIYVAVPQSTTAAGADGARTLQVLVVGFKEP